jgi:O-antigen/teichoic acid export membrane protein
MSSAVTDIKGKTIKGFFWLGSTRILGQTVLWAFSIVTVRLLDPADYGLMALALFFILFFGFINEFGLGSAIVQWKRLDLEEVHSCFWFMLIINMGMYLFVYLVAYPIGFFFQDLRLVPVIRILALTFIINAIRAVPYALLRRRMEFKIVSKCQLIPSLLSGPLILGSAINGFGVWSLVIGSMFQNVLFAALLFYYYPWRPQLRFSFNRIKGMLRFGISVNASKILTFLSGQADTLIVGKMLGAQSLGLYNVAFMIAILPVEKVSEIIYNISFSVFSQLQDNRARLASYFQKANKYIALAGFPAIAGIFLIADSFVIIVLGEKWAPIMFPLKILCVVGILRAIAMTMIPFLHGIGRADSVFKFSILNGIVMPLAFVVGTHFGITGVAVAWIMVYPFLVGYLVLMCIKELGLSLHEYVRNLAPAVGGTIFMAIFVTVSQKTLFNGNLYVHLIGSMLSGIILFIGFVYFVNRESLNEIKNAVLILKQKQA